MSIKERIPNFLTISRFFLSPLAIVFLAISKNSNSFFPEINGWSFWAAILFFICVLTDFLDGYLSRKWGCVSKFGKTYDPMADKLLIIGTLICLMCKGRVMVFLGVILILRDVIMDLIVRPLIKRRGLSTEAIKSAKLKTITQMAGLMIILLFCNNVTEVKFFPPFESSNWKNWLTHSTLFVSSVLSIFSFWIYLKKLINSRKHV